VWVPSVERRTPEEKEGKMPKEGRIISGLHRGYNGEGSERNPTRKTSR